jgi:SAM-dependent methyltransferase
VLSRLAPKPGQRIVDVGTAPFSLLSLYLPRLIPTLVAIDIDPYIAQFHANARKLHPGSAVFGTRQDARRLGMKSESFDGALAVSSIEHIPESGDVAAIREIARVIKPGSRAVVSVPWATSAGEEWVDESETRAVLPEAGLSALRRRPAGRKVFFQRRYDDEALHERLIRPSGLRLVDIDYFGERRPLLLPLLRRRTPLAKALTNWLNPFLASATLTALPRASHGTAEGAVITLAKD